MPECLRFCHAWRTSLRFARPLLPHPGVLWSLAPGLAVFLIFYALGGTWITAAGFGRRLMRLTYSVLQREADLRFALVRWLARGQGGWQ